MSHWASSDTRSAGSAEAWSGAGAETPLRNRRGHWRSMANDEGWVKTGDEVPLTRWVPGYNTINPWEGPSQPGDAGLCTSFEVTSQIYSKYNALPWVGVETEYMATSLEPRGLLCAS